jgi:hypothetical protein
MGAFRTFRRQFWRPLIGLVVAYAVATQSLLIALGGFALPAAANDSVPGIELCLHDAQGAPALPATDPAHAGCSHCIFCFAGSHHAVIGATPAAFHRVDVEISVARSMADTRARPALPPHSIASPRGPPSDA